MEQAKQARRMFALRLSEQGVLRIKERAAERGGSVSEEARIMLAYATIHMPKGWKPPGR